MLLPALLFGVAWALTNGRWCEQTETILVQEEVAPRQEDLVPCASLYHYQRLGWRLDLSRSGRAGLCPIFKPPETRPAAWNRTVRACCPGWGGSHCTLTLAEAKPKGHCFATRQCQPGTGSANASAGSLEECCALPWGQSWRDGRSQACLNCSSQQRPGSTPSPAVLQPLPGAVAQLRSQRPRPSATCTTWSGFHYRTFDGHHYHFLGRCTYLLAGAADSAWAVHLEPRDHCPQPGHCQLARVMMGPEEVLIRGGNVSVNGQLVPEGESRLLPGLSLQWQGDWLVLAGGLGVVVRLDRSTSISISVDHELQGQTQGLCGVYNGRPEDDFLEPGGGLAALAATFGNSWRLPDSEPGCLDAVEAARGCEDPLRGTEADTEAGQLRAEAQDVCHQLLDGPFRECHAQVPPAEYHEACLFAYCAGAAAGSGRAGRQEAVCTTLASYARDCGKQGIYLRWRKPGFCERLCPGGQLYVDCASACPPSCSAVGEGGEGSCREECVSGCECPPGLFWDGALCVPASRCPCHHRRQRYAPGDVVRQLCNPCVCQDGRWVCAQAPCPAECAVGGDGHYLTFDGRSFSFRGSPGCRSSLVQDVAKGQLLVTLEHGACDSGSCLHAISVSLGDTHVQLRDSGDVLADGQDVGLPWSGPVGLSISRASSTFLLLRWPGAQVLWGVSDPAVYITLDPRYAHQVQGLCGTFTWNQQDDFLTPAGDVETSTAAFVSKFQLAGEGRCPSEDNALLPPCSTHPQRHVFAETACAVLHGPAFQECHGLVDREPFHLRCLAAMCGCASGRACLCPVLAAYARRCAQEGASSPWRSQTLCPVLCPGGQEYQECAPVCGRSCGEPEDCGELGGCVAGCNCPSGLLWDPEGQCVPPSLCPCQLGARRYAPGRATMKDCNRCVCQERGLWNCTARRCAPQRAFCPRELVYAPGACLLTCDSPGAEHTCTPGSTGGCVCPPGTVWLDERCVPPELCPCRHGGQWYPPNATIQEDCNVCVCRGRQWHCTGQRCGGWCQASGAPHYVTFDGLVLTFPGACEYLLVREASGQFTVSAQNLPCGAGGLTCTKALTVRLQSTVVHMLRGRAVTVNGVSITPPKVYTGPGLSLRRAGLFLLLATRLGLTLLWDGGTRVLVQLSPQFRGRVAGLCGDFDGDASNDLRSRQGVLEPTAELAAHSWRLSPLCPEPGDLPHPCTVNTHRAGWARARCGVLLQSLFASCHPEVPPQQHYEWCLYDACGCDSGGDCECLCSAIATYADECARHGLHVRWRSQDLCPLQCEGGQVYEACGPTCPPTCHDHGPESGWHCQAVPCVEGCFCPEGTLLHGGACLEPTSCPCEWGGSFFPPGTVLQKDCGNCTCQESRWLCGGRGTRCEDLVPGCAEGEAPCQGSGRCVPHEWLCDNQDDCGDGSDEEGCATPGCGEGQLSCSSGRCLPLAQLCDGQDDCGDGTDEQGCPCPQDWLACADGRCLPPALLCDGHPDCPDAADEESCLGQVNCTPGEVSCVDGTCVGAMQLCDGIWDCPDGSDEGPGHCPLPSLPIPPAGTLPSPSPGSWETASTPLASTSPVPACGPLEFPCGGGECVPRGWRCDQEEDCADGSDEHGCGGPCARHHAPCASGPHCVARAQLCDGVPHCPDASDEGPDACGSTQLPPCGDLFPCASAPQVCLHPERLCDGVPDCPQGEDELACEGLPAPGGPNGTQAPCPEYSCPHGLCIGFQLVCDGHPDCDLAGEAGASPEEQGCGAWGPWSPWEPCSRTCGPGVQARSRRCSPPRLLVLQLCPGPERQTQACFAAACPVDGEWASWSPWSSCPEPCTGTMTRQRRCLPPQNGGRTCAMLPGGPHSTRQTQPCPQDSCPNATCSGELVFRPCAPCPLTCDDISGQAACPTDRPCSSPGCWCPAGQVLGGEGRCVWPGQCPCLVDGARYSPGQQVKADCQLCVCRDGRPQGCRPNPDCAVNCGWSSWSPWAACLGPCGSWGIQWSFRSPNNPRLSGQGRQCRGIYRKARRCQTEPCEGCDHLGRVHRVGERWRGGPCLVCQCLHGGTARCSPYCPLGSCPQGWVLVEGVGESCCHCALPGEERVSHAPASKAPLPSPGESVQTATVTPTSQPEAEALQPGTAAVTVPPPHRVPPGAPTSQGVAPAPFPPVRCSPGQVPCKVLGCVEQEQLCDGEEDCLDGSDERLCAGVTPFTVPSTALPGLPASRALCSPRQLACGSGECLPSARRCDLRPDCQDGSDEEGCVDCGLAPWSGWSSCSRSCGLGIAFQRRELLRPPLAGGSCPDDRLRSQPCFVQACPVAGAWTAWEAWGPCSVSCGGGHRSRRRRCMDPPPKNGGAPCPGASQERVPCSLQPCTGGTDCGPGRVHVSAELCRRGLVPPCPASCLDPEAKGSCGGLCLEGCRCPPELLLHGARCLPLAECPCLVGGEPKQPGLPFLLDNCSRCVCEQGALRCEPGGCPVPCGWSAWSSWSPCDRSCGSGVRARFRSPSNPPAAYGGAPCEGDRQELQACHSECGTDFTWVPEPPQACQAAPAAGPPFPPPEALVWTPWAPWSACSQSCLALGGGPGWRSRSRLCPSSGNTSCPGEDTQEEPCSPPVCPVSSVWGLWGPWSACSAPCDGGIQTRGRSCSGSAPGDPECQGPHSQTRDCNTQPCSAQCPGDMVFRSAEQCHQEGGPCPRLCLAQGPGVECTGSCAPGCACPPGLFLHNASCLPRAQCPCQLHGQLYAPGAAASVDPCNNCTCVSGEMVCTSEPCPVACGWSPWTPWSLCSRSCNVGIRRRFRVGTAPPAAFGGSPCQGPDMETEFCSLRPCRGPGGEWGPWSPCSVPCGGGFRNRTRGSGPNSPVDFSTCGLQPCAGPVPGVCPTDKLWLACAQGPASCAELSAPRETNWTCRPGCHCPPGTLLLNNVCVPARDCPCVHGGRLHAPHSAVLRPCENCSCVSGLITDCTPRPCEEGPPAWSPWTPWSECSASCGSARRHRHRFCARPPSVVLSSGAPLPPAASPAPLCPGPEAEEEPCLLPGCDRAGGWGPWAPWSSCSRSCGGGLRSRTRACDQPPPQGLGDYCEGPQAQGEACQALSCPVTDCASTEGAEYNPCGPPCPRSCDDLVHCVWRCQPGCYCPPGQVLSADGALCVQPGHCSCLDLLTGERLRPGAQLARPDGCNYCICSEGKLNCTDLPCPVPGGWCLWSEWTACSQPCRGQTRARSRACACPAPRHGGSPCPGEAEEAGPQHQSETCPSPSACPADGAWSPWGPWSPCDACLGQSHRTRACSWPPTPEGGRPCPGGHRQSRACQDNSTQCTDCGGGQTLLPCGQPCPRSCQDLSPGSVCQPGSTDCQPSCGCPPGQLSQDGLCVAPAQCRCQYQPRALGIPENRSRSAGSALSSWESLDPGEVVAGPCDNCTCVAGTLRCQEVPGCPGPGVWGSWGRWEDCSVSCGGGEQLRSRSCARPPCPGPARQSRACHTQVCRDTGCPAGRLYRECLRGEACPFSCAHVTQQVACFSGGCEEGCHCPEGTFQHRLACVQECPCLLTASVLQELGAASADPWARPPVLGERGQPLGPGDELDSGQTLHTGCSNCSCVHGKLSCSVGDCSKAGGGFGPWGPWGPCSRSCGGLGTRARARACAGPSPAAGGQGCRGPLQDLGYCLSPDCPGAAGSTVEPVTGPPGGWGAWSPWSPCSRSCTDPVLPAWRGRIRLCLANCSGGHTSQERPCNLPSCTGLALCPGPGCVAGNCSWAAWGPWGPCSRSCGVGQQQRLRAYRPPGPGGHWCPDILTAYQERRFCSLRACPVPGGWSRWSPWSWCDRSCGGGRSLRSRSCSSPPPKNGGAPCAGERHQARPCNPMPCEEGCPAGMEVVSCADRCPRRCSDLQEGMVCQEGPACQPGCRCPEGSLEQDGGCVPRGHCECTDAQGRSWAPGSQHQEACSNCTCRAGRLSCAAQACPPPAHCAWSRWSAWSPCSRSCGPGGQQSRFRSSTSGSWALECREEQSQSQPCPQPPCPPLCLHDGRPRSLGDSWRQGECQQCSCTPEGVLCEDRDCTVPGAWTPWAPWSDCPVSCGGGTQARTRVCTASDPHLTAPPCLGPDTQTQRCGLQPCPGLREACSWGLWGPCSQSCGPGLASRSGSCPCPLAEANRTCNGSFFHLDTQACYLGPCLEECVWGSWSSWTPCSCQVQVQQRYRHQSPAPGAPGEGAPCTRLDGHFRPCLIGNCSEDSCTPPFKFQACGSPCASLCATHRSHQLCQDLPPCQPGCYCPEGLLEQTGGCVPAEQCSCQHISGGARVTLAPGDHLQLGCKECECQLGELQCTSRGCQGLLPLSGWSEWSPCGPCLPASVLAPASRAALEERWPQDPAGLPPTSAPLLASEQHRHRLCLDPETGRPWAGDPDLCTGPLSQQRLCLDPAACGDLCQWSPWGPWSPCQVPCSGGFRLRWREAGTPARGGCRGPWAQTESCNTGPCPGESCEARDTVLTLGCANQCPRSCVDLWDRVQCLQGPCHPGCRCPPGHLVQDGRCVPISSCRCGLPSSNASWVLAPAEGVRLDCRDCTCVNGSLLCPHRECPALGPWSAWSRCSVPCGGGTTERHRSCEEGPGGTPCQAQDTEQRQDCNLQPCPECPPGQVFRACATSCPRLCSHLRPGALCTPEPCQSGCGCPGQRLLHNGTCVPPAACPCAQLSLPWGLALTPEERAQELPSGTVLTWNCTRCVCQGGAFNCSRDDCEECPPGEVWQQLAPGEPGPCERTCQEPNATEAQGDCGARPARGCVCRRGYLRSQAGPCVTADRCECWRHGRPHPPGSEWQEACATCRCLGGRSVCAQHCPPLTCAQDEVVLQEPGSCCPSCHRETLAEQSAPCQRLTELRNLTKGPCYLDQVAVSYCSGYCPSSTNVMPEEPYLLSQCDCCSYRLDPESPVRLLHLRCPGGHMEPVVLPVVHSCQCSACQGGDFSKR